jgi:copper transport protein
MSRQRTRRALILACAAVVGITAVAYAHTALRRSEPAEDARLEEPPTAVTLSFTTAVDARLARVQLLRPDGGSVSLDSLRTGETDSIVVAPIAETLAAAEYTVVWQVVGSDGHPVRGQFAFVVDPQQSEQPQAPPQPEPESPPIPVSDLPDPATDVQAPSYVAARWLTFTTLLVVIGAVVFRALVLEPVRRRSSLPSGGAADVAAARAAALGRGAAAFLVLGAGVRLLLQARALDMGGDTMAALRVMLLDTPWGWGWLLQVGAALLVLGGFQRATRDPRRGWGVAAIAALALAFTPALSGHAAAVEGLGPVAVVLDGAHVLGASAWLGTLLVLLLAGVPAALAQGGPAGRGMVADLVNRFSPLALVFAGFVAATGVAAAVIHLAALSELWGTAYGRTLLVKVGLVAIVILLGAYNWRRVRPTLTEAGPARLRRSAALELIAAAAILLATSILVATPTP